MKETQVGATENNGDSFVSSFSQNVSHQYFTWGMTLRIKNVIFSLYEKVWKKKYPYGIFNHLSTTSASI